MMSTDTDVYNPGSQPLSTATPSSSSPLPAPQFGSHLQPAAVLKTCSVRGCNQALPQESMNKMCEGCRGRHRIYASTKRARRKLEKAAVVGLRRVGEHPASPHTAPQTSTTATQTAVPNSVVNVVAAGASATPSSVQPQMGWMQPTLAVLAPVTSAVMTQPATAPPTWDNTAIDPQLFAEPSTSASTVSLHHSMVPAFARPPYPSSSSSELAGALTLPTSNNNSNSSNAPTNNYYRTHMHEQKDDTQAHEAEENEVAQALQAPEAEADAGDANPADTNADMVSGSTDAAPEETGPQRPCSVKGCKAMIPSSYTYKMCPPCRTRYRTYGNTKRAKWKAEREAFDRELAGLRTKEDERRKIAGERPLSESPDDLHAWELSVIDEEVSHPLNMPGSGSSTNGNSGVMIQASVYPPGTITTTPSEIDTVAARMCTVSHCHKLLPGFYRYKRCEQHRLQNRYHSKLKRVRERSEKAAMVQDGGAGVGGNGEEDGEENRDGDEEETKKEPGEGEGDVADSAAGGGGEGDGDGDGDREDEGEGEDEEEGDTENKDKNKKRRTRRRTACEMKTCQNMLAPGVRWRRCEVCRARERVFRREKKEIEEGQVKEVERFREIVRLMEEGVIPPGTGTGLVGVQAQAQVVGSGRGTQAQKEKEYVEEENAHEGGGDTVRHGLGTTSTPASMSATINPDSNIGMNTDNNSEALEPAKSYSLTSYPHTFQSVFRANFDSTPVPTATANTNTTENTHIVTTATATAVEPQPQEGSGILKSTNTNASTNTAEAQLTFHEYKPKPAAAGAAKGRGLEMGKQAQVFRDMVQRDQQTSSGMVGPSSYHVYKSTLPSPVAPTSTHVPAPTLPLGAPTPAPAPAATTTAHQHSAYTTYDSGTASSALQVYEPPAKRQKTQATSNNIEAGGAENSKQNEKAFTEPSKAPHVNAAASSSGTVATTQPPTSSQIPPSPPSNVIPRQRKARASRPKQPPPAATPVSHPVPSYPYMSASQYPYSYYMPPPYAYSMQTSFPRPSSSSASGAPTPSAPYPSYAYPYAYSYPPPGSYPPGTPPPGYGYLQASRYHPGVYALSPPPPHHQGAYAAPYGYTTAPSTKDRAFSYYQPPLDKNVGEADKKRKSEETGTSAPSVSVSAPTPAPTSAPAPAPPQHSIPVVAQEYVLRPANVTSQQPAATDPVTLPVPVQPASVPTDNTVASNEPMGDESPEALSTAQPSPRACVNKTCHRTIPTDVVGTLCEKCRMRIKRHQVKARQRFKLEPRKSMLMGRGNLVLSAKVAVAGEVAVSNEVVAAA